MTDDRTSERQFNPPSTSDWLYVWQVWNPETNKWELIGMAHPDQMAVLPMVTTRADVADGLTGYARDHAAATGQRCRLVNFVPGAVLAEVEPTTDTYGKWDSIPAAPDETMG
jgi:hypothetical protein